MIIKKLKTKPERMCIIHDNANEPDPKAGDIFVFSVNKNEFQFGRVVADKVSSGPTDTNNIYIVIYIYIASSVSKDVIPFSLLTINNLLIDPIIFPIDYWKMGYMQTVAHEDVNVATVHEPLCFQVKHLVGDPCFDENWIQIKKQNICGESGIWNIFGLEQKVCSALGQPIEDDNDKKENKKSNSFVDIKMSEYEGTHSLAIEAQENITKVFEVYGEGLTGNGYDMQSLFKNIIKNKNPDLLDSIDFDSEANMFCLYTKHKKIVEEVKNIIIDSIYNENALMTEIKNVPEEEWE